LTITDLTERYANHQVNAARFAINRAQHPFCNVAIHHTGSSLNATGIPFAYGIRTDGHPVSEAAERAAIDSLANDHRTRFGIGPGYTGVVFQSGRGYWVGKAGTVRRHTTNKHGRDDGNTWNFDTVAIVIFGNTTHMALTRELLQTIQAMVDEVLSSWGPLVKHPVKIFGHSDVFGTECPGDGGRAIVRYLNSAFGGNGKTNLGVAPPAGGKSSDTADLSRIKSSLPQPPAPKPPTPPTPAPVKPRLSPEDEVTLRTVRSQLVGATSRIDEILERST